MGVMVNGHGDELPSPEESAIARARLVGLVPQETRLGRDWFDANGVLAVSSSPGSSSYWWPPGETRWHPAMNEAAALTAYCDYRAAVIVAETRVVEPTVIEHDLTPEGVKKNPQRVNAAIEAVDNANAHCRDALSTLLDALNDLSGWRRLKGSRETVEAVAAAAAALDAAQQAQEEFLRSVAGHPPVKVT